MHLQFRAEFFNVLNQATFATPGVGTPGAFGQSAGQTLLSPTFGLSTATATVERQIQFGLRFMF
jgi:hypothetical protein